MNQRLITWLREHRGKRLGIVCESLDHGARLQLSYMRIAVLDFYDATPELVENIIGGGR